MAARATSPRSVTPLTARKTWRTVEPLHGMVYFAPEASASYTRLGLEPGAGYFASRSAAMGAVGAETVIATFYNFDPRLVRAAIPGAWRIASPAVVLEARLEAADGALRRMLGEGVDSPDMARAADLARRAAERATLRYEGRPLFAAHAGLDWPDLPHLVLWHAQTLLREFRGDGHITTLVQHDLDPVEALAMHLASGELTGSFLRDSRGWPEVAWDSGVERLRHRGLIEMAAPGADDAALTLTGQGLATRQEIEDATDRMAVFPYEALGEEECAELRTTARPFSRAVVDAAGFGR
ncbi:MAG TPA: hypothetical protein VMQ59_06990 [Acidimicrobiales bacterium]|jgi:hypothetical protein|nr:hypothetical protein [Acidimicrobiales bacterium]